MSAAARLPAQAADALLDAAAEAFTRGLQVSATAGMIVLLVMAAVALITLPGADTGSDDRSARRPDLPEGGGESKGYRTRTVVR